MASKKIGPVPFILAFANRGDFESHMASIGAAEASGFKSQINGMRAVMIATVASLADPETAAAEGFRLYREAFNAGLPEAAEKKATEGKSVESDVSRWNCGVKLAGLTVGKANAATAFLAKFGDRPEYYGNPTNRFPSAVRAALKAAADGKELSEAAFVKAVSDGKGKAPESDVEFCNRLVKAIGDRLKGNPKKDRPAMRDHDGQGIKAAEALKALAAALKSAALQPAATEAESDVVKAHASNTRNRHAKPVRLSDLDAALAAKTGGTKLNGATAH